MTVIQDTLRLFGITRCYKGFQHTAYAIYLAVQDESRLEAVTKEIYMGTASHFNCNWTAVERNIRTAVARAWRINRPLLVKIAGYLYQFHRSLSWTHFPFDIASNFSVPRLRSALNIWSMLVYFLYRIAIYFGQ